MQKVIMKGMIAALIMCIAIIAQVKADSFSGQLWNKYRVSLIKIFHQRFPSLSGGVPVDNTILSVLTDPDEANWATSRYHLQETFAKYPMKWSSRFAYQPMTADGTIPALYKKATLMCKDPAEFTRSGKAPKDTFYGKLSSKWDEKGTTLGQFMNTVRAGRAPKLHFIVEESKGTTITPLPWGRSTPPITHAGSFVKQIQTKTNADNEFVEDSHDEAPMQNQELSETTLWRRRRRRRRPPPPPPKPIVIKSQKFKMDFQSTGFAGIRVEPSPTWFSRNWIRAHRTCMNPLTNRNGRFSVIPRVAWVAYKPKIKLTLSKTEWENTRRIWNAKSTIGLLVGGSLFRHSRYRNAVRNDKEMWNTLSEEQRALYSDDSMAAFHSDNVVFHVEKREVKADNELSNGGQAGGQPGGDEVTFTVQTDIVDTASFTHKTKVRLAEDDEEPIISNNKELSETMWWRRRRRRRRPPPPPPPPKKIYEQVYHVNFASNSPFPEILAVTGEKVASI